jgi:hypothetical protein
MKAKAKGLLMRGVLMLKMQFSLSKQIQATNNAVAVLNNSTERDYFEMRYIFPI